MLSDMFKDLDQGDNESQRKIWHTIHKSLPHLGVIGVEGKWLNVHVGGVYVCPYVETKVI